MATTTAFGTKKYLADSFKQLAEDYSWAVKVTYGPFVEEEGYASFIQVTDVTIETSPYSSGATRRVMYEEYSIECAVMIVAGDETCEVAETRLHAVYSIIEDFIRDDLMESKLGGNVNEAICSPGSIQSRPGSQGGSVAVMLFNVNCKAKVR